jgi:hypothetical protein
MDTFGGWLDYILKKIKFYFWKNFKLIFFFSIFLLFKCVDIKNKKYIKKNILNILNFIFEKVPN